jgi:hypothetical protein
MKLRSQQPNTTRTAEAASRAGYCCAPTHARLGLNSPDSAWILVGGGVSQFDGRGG